MERRRITSLPERSGYGEKGEPTFFERYRTKGKYQDISTNLKLFGFDFFKDAEVKIVSDRKEVPVPPSYIVGPGDEVKIVLWGRVNNELYLTVDRNGTIAIPDRSGVCGGNDLRGDVGPFDKAGGADCGGQGGHYDGFRKDHPRFCPRRRKEAGFLY